MLRRILLLLIIIVLSVPIAANLIAGSVPVRQATINPDTVADLQLAERYGTGSMNEVVAFSPVDERIAVGSNRGVYIFNSLDAEPQLIELYHANGTPFNVTSLFFSPDGNSIFAGNGEEIVAYDLLEQTTLYHIDDGEQVLSFNRDGSLLLYEMVYGVNVLNIASGDIVRELSYEGIWSEEIIERNHGVDNNVEYVQFMADDEQIILKHSQLSWAAHGEERRYTDIWTNDSHEQAVTVFEFIPDYPDAVAETDDGTVYAISGYQIYTENGVSSLFDEDTDIRSLLFDAISFSSDKTIFAMQYTRLDRDYNRISEITVWNAITLEQVFTIEIEEWSHDSLTLSPDGSLLAIGHDVYDVATGEHLRTLSVDSYELFATTYERLLHYSTDGNLYLLDANLNELTNLGRTDRVANIPRIDSADPGYLWIPVNSDLRGQIRVSLETGTITGTFQSRAVNYYRRTISPDSNYVAFYETFPAEIWNMETVSRIDLPEYTTVLAPFFSPDSQLLLFNHETFEIWFYDITADEPVSIIPAQADGEPYFFIEFSDDGQRVLIVQQIERGQQNLARVYDLNDMTAHIFEANSHVLRASLSGDGNFIALASDDYEVSVIEIASGDVRFQQTVEGLIQELYLFQDRIGIYFQWDVVSYDLETGELYESLSNLAGSDVYTIFSTDSMFFNKVDTHILRITAADGVGLREIDLGRAFSSVRLSDDGQRLWIDFSDGTVELWTIQP